MAERLKPSEERLHESLQSAPKHVLKKAKLLLLRDLLLEVAWEDTDLVSDLSAGLPLVGEIPKSGVFPGKEPQATMS
eukprot:6293836-Heterocapsa_arctica.AAC.1